MNVAQSSFLEKNCRIYSYPLVVAMFMMQMWDEMKWTRSSLAALLNHQWSNINDLSSAE